MDRHSKSINLRIVGFLTICFMAVLLMFHTEKAMAVELYFDDEGNLMHVTKDVATNANICFRSVGWVIKRYDLPLNANGQQYIVVPKRSDRSVIMKVDGTDIMYTYFKSTNKEILSAIETISKDWLEQLKTYGGTVYIDTAMTVVENKVPKGGIDTNGRRWGEVYLTFDGIAGARAWGGYDALKLYFDMHVEFPRLIEIPEEEILWNESEFLYTSEPISNLFLESKGIYNVDVAIPSGSILKATGKASSYKYFVKVGKITGTVKIPVEITKTYILKWKDSKGIEQTQTRQINRYYLVERDFSYYTCKDAKLWLLNKLEIYNDCILGKSYTKAIHNTNTLDICNYGAIDKHISTNINRTMLDAGTVVISRNDGLKPDIPNEDLRDIAELAVSDLSVRSDKISICGNTILKDDICNKSGKTPIYFEPPCSVINFENIMISETSRNKKYEGTYKTTYVLSKNTTGTPTSNEVIKTGSLNSIKIHTPVICKGDIIGEEGRKDLNGNELTKENIVIGATFKVNVDFNGYHSDYIGYGESDYSQYIGQVMIKFPFPIYYNKELIPENTWIKIINIDYNGYVKGFKLPKEIKHGEYEIDIKAYAINALPEDILGGEYTNAPTDGYYATNTIKVNVVRGFFDTTEHDKYKVVGTH